MSIGILLAMSLGSLPVALQLVDLAPHPGTWRLLRTVAVCEGCASIAGTVCLVSFMSALADIADEQEFSSGRRSEGMLFSARSFFGKVASGTGYVCAGFALNLIGFPTQSLSVSAAMIQKLRWIDAGIPIVFSLASALLFGNYRMRYEDQTALQAALQKRRGSHGDVHRALSSPHEIVTRTITLASQSTRSRSASPARIRPLGLGLTRTRDLECSPLAMGERSHRTLL